MVVETRRGFLNLNSFLENWVTKNAAQRSDAAFFCVVVTALLRTHSRQIFRYRQDVVIAHACRNRTHHRMFAFT